MTFVSYPRSGTFEQEMQMQYNSFTNETHMWFQAQLKLSHQQWIVRSAVQQQRRIKKKGYNISSLNLIKCNICKLHGYNFFSFFFLRCREFHYKEILLHCIKTLPCTLWIIHEHKYRRVATLVDNISLYWTSMNKHWELYLSLEIIHIYKMNIKGSGSSFTTVLRLSTQ